MSYRNACEAVKSSLMPQPYKFQKFRVEIPNPDGFDGHPQKQTSFAVFKVKLVTQRDASSLFSIATNIINLEVVEADNYSNVTAVAWAHTTADKSVLGSKAIVTFFKRLLAPVNSLLVKEIDYFSLPE